ncbi:hypothetical protein CLV49_1915 [Labedella gwakjiensis]|uniref:Uncharacterized protein n=1 Tax=Labedella gwakjiensis TaxID=390269 RepID=A0A2P8GWF9_9MICO|nr:hypothetical protein [Labedella gwakjiensis]PSL38296.1 hypothetical protein CLV49_1915 [Labedella gwakjiensis]RUQ87168.1 hypothetical protein ELQ93_09645 [Labedella gwakjiensis]
MKAYAGLWGSMFGVFLLAAVTSAAMLGPPGRRNRYLDAELAEAIGGPATVAGLAIGLLVVLLPLPKRRSFASATETCAIVVLILTSSVVAYRAIVGANDSRDLDPGTLNLWLLGAAGILVLLIVVAIRADRARRREKVAQRT